MRKLNRSDKEAWRRALRRRRASLPPAERAARAARIAQHAWSLVKGFPSCLLYASAGTEVDTRPLATRLREGGVAVYYPRVLGSLLVAVRVEDEGQLVPGFRGVPEPPAHLPAAPWSEVRAAVIPGLGFTPDGRRLGQGGGHYDRLLAVWRPELVLGLAFAVQIVPDLPVEEHDQRVDGVVTEDGVLWSPGREA